MKLENITIRIMTPDDASQVAAVEKACFAYPWSRESFWEEASNPSTLYLVILNNEEIIGYMGAWLIGDEAHITNVAISPSYQGRHLGKKLVTHMLHCCHERHITSLTLEVRPSNAPAKALYQGLGFRSVGQRPHYYEDGEAAEIMWLTKLPELISTL